MTGGSVVGSGRPGSGSCGKDPVSALGPAVPLTSGCAGTSSGGWPAAAPGLPERGAPTDTLTSLASANGNGNDVGPAAASEASTPRDSDSCTGYRHDDLIALVQPGDDLGHPIVAHADLDLPRFSACR